MAQLAHSHQLSQPRVRTTTRTWSPQAGDGYTQRRRPGPGARSRRGHRLHESGLHRRGVRIRRRPGLTRAGQPGEFPHRARAVRPGDRRRRSARPGLRRAARPTPPEAGDGPAEPQDPPPGTQPRGALLVLLHARQRKSARDEKRSEPGRIGRGHLATFLAITLTQTTFSKNERFRGQDPLGARASTSVDANSSATARCSGFMTQQRKTVVSSLSTVSASSAVASHSLFT